MGNVSNSISWFCYWLYHWVCNNSNYYQKDFVMKTNIEPYVTLFVCGGLLAYVYGFFFPYLFIVGALAFMVALLIGGMWAADINEENVQPIDF